jgi:hypothetical protein
MKQKILGFFVLVIFIFGFYYFYSSSKLKGNTLKAQGEIIEISLNAKVITVINKESKIWNVAIEKQTQIINIDEKYITINDLYPKFIIQYEGRIVKETPGDDIIASSIKVVKAPKIIILSPKDNEIITKLPISIKGYANVKDNILNYKINDKNNGVIKLNEIQPSNYGYFEKELDLSKRDISGINPKLSINFFEDIKNGENVIVNLSISTSKKIFVYFGNTKLNPEMRDCTKVYPVERETLIIFNPGDLIQLLLSGPTENELKEGYITTIPKETKINEIGLNNGVIKIDFSNINSGGSCRVGAIRAQITETLKQIDGVKDVIISVDGNVEEALQP